MAEKLKVFVDSMLLWGYSLLMLLLVLSALVLFLEMHGFHANNLYLLYKGDEEQFMAAKTFEGILKTFTPHMLAMPISFFVLFHLASAARLFTLSTQLYVGLLGGMGLLGDIFINFFIQFSPLFAYLKLLFFMMIELVFAYIIFHFFKLIYSKPSN